MIALNSDNLPKISQTATVPSYDRNKLKAGIVHIGLGNFHRAHQAWYLHRLFEQQKSMEWAIVGADVYPYGQQMRAKLVNQDCLTTLIEVEENSTKAQVIGSMIDYVAIEEGNLALVNQMAQPSIRIVSLTVTEGGYFVNPATQGFDEVHPDIQHDAKHPDFPKTAFGAMVAALKIRRDNGYGPFTGLSCDNVRGNGDILRQTLVSLAKLSDPDLSEWIDQNCSFPNSMVDCIVPATGEREIALVESFNISDKAPVTHEHFHQWVIEDEFCAGRPELNEVGVTFTANVHDYENMKIRILNGGHQLIAQIGDLLSINTISDSMKNEKIRALFEKVEIEEIVPHVDSVPEFTAEEYVGLIEKRLSNSAIVDTTRRVAFDGSSRHPGFILPVVREGLESGNSVNGLAFISAVWARYCTGVREDGTTIQANDPSWTELNKQAIKAQAVPRSWLTMTAMYGDLIHQSRFADAFESWLNLINEQGVLVALNTYLERT